MRRLTLVALLALSGSGLAHPVPETGSVTFLVTSDTHFGAEGLAALNDVVIDQMNALPGRPWPEPIRGRVNTPRGVIVTGDLTDGGRAVEFAAFEKAYGLTGRDGRLRFPVRETIGNHDSDAPSTVASGVHGVATEPW